MMNRGGSDHDRDHDHDHDLNQYKYAYSELCKHLQRRLDVQNIDMMNSFGFCRNCLAKWLRKGELIKNLSTRSSAASYEQCLRHVYGMDVNEWKRLYQKKATEEQLSKFKAMEHLHATHDEAIMVKDSSNSSNDTSNDNDHKTSGPVPVQHKNDTNTNLLSDVCCEDVDATCETNNITNNSNNIKIKIGILTVSDRAFKGVYEDISGKRVMKDAIDRYSHDWGKSCEYKLVPDEEHEIENALIFLSDAVKCDVIITTGGTGLAKRDVTPDATKRVCTREIKGIAESLRAHARKFEKHAALSRAFSGSRNDTTLIVNLPGRPNAVAQSLQVLLPILSHAVKQIKGA